MKDLRLIELEKRESFGLKETVGAIIIGSTLFMVGFFAYVKISNAIPTTGFTTADNTTYDSLKTNVRSAFDIGSITLVMIGIAAIISVIFSLFQ